MKQADINARMLPWGDREIARFIARVALFVRRGWAEAKAEAWADRLALRDQERDDRRSCVECSHLQQTGGCFAAQQGRLPYTSAKHHPVTDLLQRCECFSWQTP